MTEKLETKLTAEYIPQDCLEERSYWISNSTWNGRVKETFGKLPLLPKDSRILDWGCSYGLTTQEIQKLYPDSEVVGIDINPEVIQFAEILNRSPKFYREHGYRLPNQPPFMDESFDMVVLMNNLTFDNVGDNISDKDYRSILQGITRLVKSKGYLSISCASQSIVLKKNQTGFDIEDSEVKLIEYKNLTQEELKKRSKLLRISYLLSGKIPRINWLKPNDYKNFITKNMEINND
ncbi:MAG: class I SAM-dependent methyltransferase [Candidatus Pacearchaeota archaeon]|jgi:SAM-dependent methyltransferase